MVCSYTVVKKSERGGKSARNDFMTARRDLSRQNMTRGKRMKKMM